MTEIILGGIGALLVIAAFIAGTAYGYKVSAAAKVGGEVAKLTEATTKEVEEQRKRMKDDNEAFNTLMGYDVSAVYGTDKESEQ